MGDTQYRGYPVRSRETLVEMVSEAHRAGKQIAIHGNGDAAIDDILSAYEQAQQKTPRTDTRHRIEHCQTVREDQLDKMQTLGVTPSFFVQHTYYWGDRHEAIFLGPVGSKRYCRTGNNCGRQNSLSQSAITTAKYGVTPL